MARVSMKDWHVIADKLQGGLKYRNVKLNPASVTAWSSPDSKILYLSAERTGQIEGLGQDAGASIVNKLQTGELFPDQVAGWSTKTILASLLVLMLLKARNSR